MAVTLPVTITWPCNDRLHTEMSACQVGTMREWFIRRTTYDALWLGRTPLVVTLCYAALGLCASAAEQYEIFPFFSWFLFPITPNQVVQYELTPSPQLSRLGALHEVDLHVLVQKLGRAVAAKDQNAERELRRRLEGNFFVSPCRYTLTRTEYDPKERWLNGTVRSAESVAEFHCSETP